MTKNELITKLIKEGSITFEEALLLNGNEPQPQAIPNMPYLPYSPNTWPHRPYEITFGDRTAPWLHPVIC